MECIRIESVIEGNSHGVGVLTQQLRRLQYFGNAKVPADGVLEHIAELGAMIQSLQHPDLVPHVHTFTVRHWSFINK